MIYENIDMVLMHAEKCVLLKSSAASMTTFHFYQK